MRAVLIPEGKWLLHQRPHSVYYSECHSIDDHAVEQELGGPCITTREQMFYDMAELKAWDKSIIETVHLAQIAAASPFC